MSEICVGDLIQIEDTCYRGTLARPEIAWWRVTEVADGGPYPIAARRLHVPILRRFAHCEILDRLPVTEPHPATVAATAGRR